MTPMNTRTKRTYNLSPSTVARVRELAETYGAAGSQDGVVELAVERLYREIREREEAAAWAAASEDPEFRSEMRDIAAAYGDRESWPA
jgi:hypothetical protein